VIPKIPKSNPINKYAKINLIQSEIFFPQTFIIQQIIKRITILVGIDTANAIKLFISVLTIYNILLIISIAHTNSIGIIKLIGSLLENMMLTNKMNMLNVLYTSLLIIIK
jgi:hypothetical protein